MRNLKWLPLALLISGTANGTEVFPTEIDSKTFQTPNLYFACLGEKQPDGRKASWVAVGVDYAEGYRTIDFLAEIEGKSDKAVIENAVKRVFLTENNGHKTWHISADGMSDETKVSFEITITLVTATNKLFADYTISKGKAVYTGKSCIQAPTRGKRGAKDLKST